VIARNITERIKVERILQKSEANLHTIFDTTDTIYVLLDNQLRIISYNPRAFAFASNELGHSIEISEYFLDYFPVEKRPVLLNYMEQVLGGKHINYEVSYPQKDSSSNWYHVRLFPISKGGTDIYGLVMAVSNITEKKLHEKELLIQNVQQQKNIIRAVLKAQEVERNKIGQELHDNVNQILSSIRMNLAMIEKEPRLRRDLIRKAKEYIDMAIDEIRLLSREQVTPQKAFDVKELIEKLINELNESSQATTKFNSEVAAELNIDKDLKLNIYRIVQEQINNILKHSDASKATLSIYENDGAVHITVIDNGKGFDPSLKRKGIGITNMRNRIESYNGDMVITSSPGSGCKLDIRIPC
jgi:PAS domain S-box-containing protein